MQTDRGIVVLSNSADPVVDLGLHLLNPSYALEVSPTLPSIKLATNQLQRYVGRYQLRPNFILTITCHGHQLYMQPPGYPPMAAYPNGHEEFFFKGQRALISFATGTQGQASALILHQDGRAIRAERIGSQGIASKAGH